MKKFNHALIMAAGRGVRMKPLTNKVPKAMANLNGNTLIGHNIYKLSHLIENIHITVGYKNSILASHVISKNVSSVINTSGKGNCWWVYNSLLKFVNEPILLLTCDNIVDLNLNKLINEYIKFKKPHCMILPVKPKSNFQGDFLRINKNRLVKTISRKIKTHNYASGIQVINPYKINKDTKKVEDFKDLWSQLIKLKGIYCSNDYLKNWFEVDTINQLKILNNKFKKKIN